MIWWDSKLRQPEIGEAVHVRYLDSKTGKPQVHSMPIRKIYLGSAGDEQHWTKAFVYNPEWALGQAQFLEAYVTRPDWWAYS